MRVLYVAYQAMLYGANRSLLGMVRYLKASRGVEPVVLVSEPGPLTKALEQEGIPVIITPFCRWLTYDRGMMGYGVHLIKAWQNRAYYRAAYRSLEGQAFDLVHTNSSLTDLGRGIAEERGIPHIWHIREYGKADFGLVNHYPMAYQRRAYGQAAAVLCVSRDLTANRMAAFRGAARAFQTVYNGVSIPQTYTKTYAAGGVVRFCVMGALEPGKRVEDVLRAGALLRAKGIEAFQIHVIGGGSAQGVEQLKALAQGGGIEDRVIWRGYQAQVDPLLQGMDVGIVPSEREAFGRVTAEYMGHYMPVIATNAGGTPELIQDAETGFLYPPGHCQALAHHMAVLLADRAKLGEMGSRGRAVALARFSLAANGDAVYDHYLRALRQ